MDATTPVNIPIRLEEWDGHDDIREVDTVVIDARPILDATEYDSLPSPDDYDADSIMEEAQTLGLVRLWDGPYAALLPESEEYPAYLEWRGAHRIVEGAEERCKELRIKEIRRRIRETQAELDRLAAELKGPNA